MDPTSCRENMDTTTSTNGCRLCLDPFAEIFTTIDNPQLKEKMEKVFTFKIDAMAGISTGVCQTCSYTIAEFYQYSEKVRENQQNLSHLPSQLGLPLDCAFLCEEVKVELDSEADNNKFSDDEHSGFSSDSDSSYEPPQKKSHTKRGVSKSKIKCSDTAEDQTRPEKTSISSTTKEMLDEEDQFLNEHFTMTCELCDATAPTFTLLRDHFRAVHDHVEPYVMCCDKRFIRRYDLLFHVKWHVDPNAFQCTLCQRQYKSKDALVMHQQIKHSGKSVTTRKNEPRKASKTTMKNAESEDSVGDTIERCDDNESNENEDTLPEEDKYLKKHFTMTCQLCGLTVSTFPLLRDHFRAEHESEEPYVMCCEKRFTRRYDLLNHVKCHVEPNAFQCELCQRQYKSKDTLAVHQKNKHSVIVRKNTPRKTKIVTTRKDAVSEDFVADTTQEKIPVQLETNENSVAEASGSQSKKVSNRTKRNEEMDQFLKTHFIITCELCGAISPTFSQLCDHFLTFHAAEQPFVMCCNKRFIRRYDLLYHIKWHVEPNAFKCELCQKQYKSKDALVMHKQVKHSNDSLLVEQTDDQSTGENRTLKECSTPSGIKAKPSDSDIEPKQLDMVKRKGIREQQDEFISKHIKLSCDYCCATKATFCELRNHFRAKHKTNHVYVLCCGEKFSKRGLLVEHLKEHGNAEHCDDGSTEVHPKIEVLTIHDVLEEAIDTEENALEDQLSPLDDFSPGVHQPEEYEEKNETQIDDIIATNFYSDEHETLGKEANMKTRTDGEVVKQTGKRAREDYFISKHIQLKCDLCNVVEPTFSELRNHFRVEHSSNNVYVLCCGEKIHKRGFLVEHIKSHSSANNSETEFCNAKDEPSIEVSLEEQAITTLDAVEQDFSYEESNATIPSGDSDSETEQTEATSTKKKKTLDQGDQFLSEHFVLECDICGVVAETFSKLRRHFLAEHKDIKVYAKCCDKQFDRRCLLLNHVKCHIDPNAFQCELCQKRYKSYEGLDLHNRIKHGLEIQKISKPKMNDADLQRKRPKVKGIRGHQDDFINKHFKLVCEHCGIQKSTFTELRSHFRIAHDTNNVYVVCCNQKISKRGLLIEHLKGHGSSNAHDTEREPERDTSEESSEEDAGEDNDDQFISKHIRIVCEICGATAQHFSHLRDHFHAQHGRQDPYVMCCQNKFSSRQALVDHVRCHVKPDAFQCEYCKRRYLCNDSLVLHKQIKHVGEYQKELEGVLQPESARTKKMDQKVNEDQFLSEHFTLSCEHCGVIAPTFGELRNHFREVHQSRYTYVKCCDKKFFKRTHIVKHIEEHLNTNGLLCKKCGSGFSSKDDLTAHTLNCTIPDDVTLYKCNHCPQNFVQEDALDAHMEQHKLLECSECKKQFLNSVSLNTHMAKVHVHKSDQLYVCEHCGKNFISELGVKRHIDRAHLGIEKPRIQCQVCKRWLKSSTYKSHMDYVHSIRDRVYECDICHKEYFHERALQDHKKQTHGVPKFKCEFCSKMFRQKISWVEHRATHTGEVLYSCDLCGEPYRGKSSLYAHLKKKHATEWSERKQKIWKGIPSRVAK